MGVPGGFGVSRVGLGSSWGSPEGPGAAAMNREELTYLGVLLGSIPVGFVLKERGEGD